MKQSGVYLLFACIGFLGCGSAASADYRLPGAKTNTLFTVYGKLTNLNGDVMTKGARAAFLWFPAIPGSRAQESQDLGRPMFTEFAELQIDVIQTPPTFPGEVANRQAELVFYLDGDGNDKLDVFELGTTSHDRVVGRAPNSRVVWGDTPSTNNSGVHPSNGSGAPVCIKEAPDYQRVCEIKDEDKGLAPAARIPIQFLNEDVLASYTCARFWGSQEWPEDAGHLSDDNLQQIQSGCASSSPSASDGSSDCHCEQTADGGWKACIAVRELCGTVFCHIGQDERTRALCKQPAEAAARGDEALGR